MTSQRHRLRVVLETDIVRAVAIGEPPPLGPLLARSLAAGARARKPGDSQRPCPLD